MSKIPLLFLLWTVALLVFNASSKTVSIKPKYVPEKLLIEHLLRNYDSRVRPVEHFKDVVNVQFSLSLMQIIDLDEKNQLLTTSMYMGWSWQDAFLQWNPNKFGGIHEVRLPATSVWRPDILIYNSASDAFDQMLKTNVIVSSNGTVEWLPPGLFKTTCHVDILHFPFDEQKCYIKFGTWTYHGGLVDLNLEYKDAQIDSYTRSGEWKFLSMKGERNSFTYQCCPNNPFVDITYTIHIRRRTLFFGFNLMLPCILICFLTLLVFVLPAEAGERITLGITVLLALVVFLQMVAENLPPSDVIPLLVKYFALSIIMVAASIVATVASLSFHHTNATNSQKMPKLMRWIFLRFLPKLLRMKRPGKNSFRQKFTEKSKVATDNRNGKINSPINKVDSEVKLKRNSSTDLSKEISIIKDAQKEMAALLREITFVTNRMRNDDKDEKIALEWKFAATVLDRFCLLFFTLYFLISTLLTIGLSPGFNRISHF